MRSQVEGSRVGIEVGGKMEVRREASLVRIEKREGNVMSISFSRNALKADVGYVNSSVHDHHYIRMPGLIPVFVEKQFPAPD